MIKIEEGGTYKAARFRSGKTDKGYWELLTVKADKGKGQTITLFPKNLPTNMYEGNEFIVKKIHSVKLKSAKDSNGEWTRQDVSIDCDIERIQPVDLDDLDDLNDLEDLL